jgi:hypothetical protein
MTDEDGHGTFITGIIASQINNGIGICGIADQVELLELKCFKGRTATVDKVISAIAAARERQCDVINMSFGMAEDSKALKDAIDAAAEEGIIVVAAAGNDGSAVLNYPAAYDNVIGVGSVDPDGNVSSFSQKNASVFVTAPGKDIMSLGHKGTDRYTVGSGTSYSVPVVTAMAAAAKSVDKDMDVQRFKSLLASTSEDRGDPGYDTSYGHGIVNIGKFAEKLIAEGNHKPLVLNGTHESPEDAAAPASYDGRTPAREYVVDMSGWFIDPDGDELEYYAQVPESKGIMITSGAGMAFVPAAEDAGKIVIVRVRAYDGRLYSDEANVSVHVGALPGSQSVLLTDTARYDKYAGSADHKDVKADLLLYGNDLTAVRCGNEVLAENKDYRIEYGATATDSSSATIYGSYLDRLPTGDASLAFEFSAGNAVEMALNIADTASSKPNEGGGGQSSGGGGQSPEAA